MSSIVYPVDRLTDYVAIRTVDLTRELADGLARVAEDHASLPGIEALLRTVDQDPVPLFGLSLYVQTRLLINAEFPDDVVQFVQERAGQALEGSLTRPGFGDELNRWVDALGQSWTQLAAGVEPETWIRPVVTAFETHYGTNEEQGIIWAQLFYLTLIADTYRQNVEMQAQSLRRQIQTVPAAPVS